MAKNKKPLKPETIRQRLKDIRYRRKEAKENYETLLQSYKEEESRLRKRCPHSWGQWMSGQYESPYRYCDICGVEDV